jgi:hypothetical protein
MTEEVSSPKSEHPKFTPDDGTEPIILSSARFYSFIPMYYSSIIDYF